MSNHSPQFEQLPMFMNAREVQGKYRPWEGDKQWINSKQRDETNQELWDRKLSESKAGIHGEKNYTLPNGGRGTLHQSIEAEGIKSPVPLQLNGPHGSQPSVLNGHHRVASMADIDSERYFPVTHVDGDIHTWTGEQKRAEAVEHAKWLASRPTPPPMPERPPLPANHPHMRMRG